MEYCLDMFLSKTSWLKRWLINLSLFIGILAAGLFVLEVMFRYIDYKKPYGLIQLKDYFKSDPVSSYDIKENCPKRKVHIEGNYFYEIWSNELGCFDEPYQNESNYILLVGDSFTHNFAQFENKWGTLVDRYCGYRVLKCGVQGYGTRQELLKAKSIISKVKIPPGLIIVGYHMNDLDGDYLFPEIAEENGFLVSKKRISNYKTGEIEVRSQDLLKSRTERYQKRIVCSKYDQCSSCSSFFQKLKCLITDGLVISGKIEHMSSQIKQKIKYLTGTVIKDSAERQKIEDQEPPYEITSVSFYPLDKFSWIKPAWENHLNNLREFKTLAKNINAKLLVVIIPAKEQVYPFISKDKGIDLEQPNKFLHAFFKKEHIEYIDPLNDFRKYANQERKNWLNPENDLYMRLDPHLSKNGEQLSGLLVSKYILESNLVNIEKKDDKLRVINEKLSSFKQ